MRYVLILLLLPMYLNAESSYRASISSISSLKSLIPTNTESLRLVKPKHSFFAYIKGVGRVRITLDEKRFREVTPIYTDNVGNVIKDDSLVTLIRGKASNKAFRTKVAGSVFYVRETPFLFVSLNVINKRTGKKYLAKLQINLNRKNKKARVYRSRRIKKDSFKDDYVIPRGVDITRKASLSVNRTAGYRELELNLDADKYWYQIFGSSSHSYISSIINEAETIYENELGVTFTVKRQNVFIDKRFGDPELITTRVDYVYYTTGDDACQYFVDIPGCYASIYNPRGPQSYASTVDAHHLFTGRDNYDLPIIGRASISSICLDPEDAVAVTQFTSLTHTGVTFMHEVAHQLGAIHDGTTSSNIVDGIFTCPAQSPANIMNSYETSDQISTFSACSINTITNFVSNYGSCMASVSEDQADATPNSIPDRTPDENPQAISPLREISLKARLNRRGRLIINANINVEEKFCDYSLLFASSERNLDRIPVPEDPGIISKIRDLIAFRRFDFSKAENQVYSAILKRKAKGKRKRNFLYLKAEMICNQNGFSQVSGNHGVSNIVRFNPSKIRATRGIKKNRWIKKVAKKLRKVS